MGDGTRGPLRLLHRRRSISARLRLRVFQRDEYTCQYCGASAPRVSLTIDHVVPVARGGDNAFANLTTACVACNAGKGADLRFVPAEHTIDRARYVLEALNAVAGALDEEGLTPPDFVLEPLADPDDVAWLVAHCGGRPVHEGLLA